MVESMEESDSFDPNTKTIMEEHENTDIQAIEENNNLTPNTGNSSNAKTRTIKLVEPVQYDPKDEPQIQPLKLVKKEETKLNFSSKLYQRMSAKRVDPITSLKPGRYDYRIKVRVIRKLRGSTKEGEVFKAFNIVLLDSMQSRIHAFVPRLCVDDLEDKMIVGKVYTIKNFTVQNYKATDIFRCVRNDRQLIFSKETHIEDVEENGSKIQVIFWDKYGENFDKAMNEQVEKPVIVILSSCKAGLWNDEVELSNVSATKYYLNYNHHSVLQLRKRMNQPKFVDIAMATTETRKIEQLKINQITKLGKEYIKSQVMLLVQIKSVVDTQSWFMRTCTTYDHETELNNGIFICKNCPRTVPHPDTKYKIHVIASDDTGDLEVIMHDREVRTLIGRRARDVLDEANFNDKYEEYRKKWGGGVMGSKSQAKTRANERILAKEAAQRMN
ncbi:hypothetical protein POM88_035911 [Heracleum sosnowskyi]|uniref:Replication protein A 70 kDa DNA-binding subunit B/D first OB fold domain-containing protein n=1 Tax=Heracleum sosnowskyi TaxID=360622 RepID=A0AAD8HMC3_9APIA|nr:hypothetical protein POM88_035911 [Heracleum sosnowskyi]